MKSTNTFLALLTTTLGIFQYQAGAQTVRLLKPSDSEHLIAGTVSTIGWSMSYSTSAPKIGIWMWNGDDGTWTCIAKEVATATGTFSWEVPNGINSGQCLIEIRSASNGMAIGRMKSYFSIRSRPSTATSKAVQLAQISTLAYPNPASGAFLVATGGHIQVRKVNVFDAVTGNTVTASISTSISGIMVNPNAEFNGTLYVAIEGDDGMLRIAKVAIQRESRR